jgi:hypothetical protein
LQLLKGGLDISFFRAVGGIQLRMTVPAGGPVVNGTMRSHDKVMGIAIVLKANDTAVSVEKIL